MKYIHSISKVLFLCFLCLAFCQTGTAQLLKLKKDKQEAVVHIFDLKQGTLLVRLVSKYKNITAIEEALERDDLSSKSRKRLNKKMGKMLKKQQRANEEIVAALDNYYDFSNYRILYDTSMTHLLAGKSEGYFLNTKMELDPNISVDLNTPVYSLRFGKGNISDTNNFEGFLISDIENKEPPLPFPYYVKSIYPPSSVIDAFIGKSASISPDFKNMIIKVNNNLTKFYINSEYIMRKKEREDELKRKKQKMEEQLKEEQDN